jgi:hypothetical protein
MKNTRSAFLLAALTVLGCKVQRPQSETLGEAAREPMECVGGEFAIRGFNQAKPQNCLDVTHYPTLKYFSNPTEYKQIAERLGMKNVLALIRSRGVEAAQQEYQLVANLKHGETLWVAQIPTQRKVTRTIFQVSEFVIPFNKALEAVPPDVLSKIEDFAKTNAAAAKDLEELKAGRYTAAHGQLRLQFSEAVQLVDPNNVEHRSSLSEIVLSVHAVSPGIAPDTYDPLKGLQNEYGTALGVYSLDDKVNQAITRHVQEGKDPSRVRQYLLTISPEAIDAALKAYFAKARSVFEKLPYNTLTRNCGSEIFEVLDQVTGFDKSRDDALSTLGRQYPKYAQFGLLKRGLVSLKTGEQTDALGMFRDDQLSTPLPTLNKETNHPEPK